MRVIWACQHRILLQGVDFYANTPEFCFCRSNGNLKDTTFSIAFWAYIIAELHLIFINLML